MAKELGMAPTIPFLVWYYVGSKWLATKEGHPGKKGGDGASWLLGVS